MPNSQQNQDGKNWVKKYQEYFSSTIAFLLKFSNNFPIIFSNFPLTLQKESKPYQFCYSTVLKVRHKIFLVDIVFSFIISDREEMVMRLITASWLIMNYLVSMVQLSVHDKWVTPWCGKLNMLVVIMNQDIAFCANFLF